MTLPIDRPDAAPAALLHEHQAARFSRRWGEDLCVLDYRLDGDRMVLTRTEVPVALRGSGRAAELVEAALGWARDEGLQVDPACSYVRTYIDRHAEWQVLLAH